MNDYLLGFKQIWEHNGEIYCKHCGGAVIKRRRIGGGYFEDPEYFCICEQAKRVDTQRKIVDEIRNNLDKQILLLDEMSMVNCDEYKLVYTKRSVEDFLSAKNLDKNLLKKILNEENE